MEPNTGGAAYRAALTSLDQARRSVARLSMRQDPEDRAADLIESWGAVETALRSLLGGSTLRGRALIHELRGRQTITLDQANSLAEFAAAKDRAEAVGYQPSESDIGAAREAFLKLETALLETGSVPLGGGATAAAAAAPVTGSLTDPIVDPAARGSGSVAPGADPAAAGYATPVARRRNPLPWIIAAIALIAVVAGAWWVFRGRAEANSMQAGVEYYRTGQRERAAAAFERATRENPGDPAPHIYLSRMAREVGNYSLAREEADKAIRANPQNAAALGEMARVLMALQNWDGARTFWVRAVQADPQDRAAQGWLACTLVRMGRSQEAQRFAERAGSGDWTACVRPAASAPGAYPPGAAPGGYPPNVAPGQGVYPQPAPPQGGYYPPPQPQPQPQQPRPF
jgi:tetratricopeptide (TPR) repeat protein